MVDIIDRWQRYRPIEQTCVVLQMEHGSHCGTTYMSQKAAGFYDLPMNKRELLLNHGDSAVKVDK